MRSFRWLRNRLSGREEASRRAAATVRPRGLVPSAPILADEASAGTLEALLHGLVQAVAGATGTGATVVTVDADDTLERLAAAVADGCVRETVARADVLRPILRRLRALGRPVGPDDLDGDARRLLEAVAPQGFLALPVGDGVCGVLVLVEPDAGPVLDETTAGLAALLVMLAGEAIANVRRLGALRDVCDDLRGLAADVLARRDRECEATAHELHESVCQDLAGASAELQALEHLLDGVPEACARTRGARQLITRSIGELREMAQRLRPVLLDHLGYVHALRWYAGRLRERTGVALSLEVEGEDLRFPVEMEAALYRATEDALASVARRHADLRVSYRHRPAAVQLEIAGTTPGAVELAAMRERLRPFRGTVRVSPPDAPPVVALELPLN